MLATWGVDTDPRRLNQWLIAHQGYANGNLMRFSAVTPFGVHFVNYINCATVPAPVQQLIQAVSGGAGVLVCMDSQPGGTVQPHWVYLTSLDKTDGQIVDPWQLPGRESRRLTSYLASGWHIVRGIFHVAIIAGAAPWRQRRPPPRERMQTTCHSSDRQPRRLRRVPAGDVRREQKLFVRQPVSATRCIAPRGGALRADAAWAMTGWM